MSFLTEYFDEYRQHPIRKTKICRPESRFAKLEGKWLDPKVGENEEVMTDEEIEAFIKETMKSLRGQSTYFNDYCAHLPQMFKYRRFVPRPKKSGQPKGAVEDSASVLELPKPLALKDTEVMKVAKALYERDMDKPTLKPLPTSFRMLSYVRPCLFKTGLSEYSESIARLAYELVRDDRIPKYHTHNGCRPDWGYPPNKTRQPELDGAPYDGERLF